MAKIVTSKERKKSGTKSLKVHVPFKSRELKDVDLVIDTLLDCIKTGDIETFREVLMAHLRVSLTAGTSFALMKTRLE